jgi:hypothetical protein
MTTNIVNELANKWLPFSWEGFFSPQRAADMWFGDELPPTLQAEVNSPFVQQSKWMMQHTLRQSLESGLRRRAAVNEQRRMAALAGRVGKRVKTSRRH